MLTVVRRILLAGNSAWQSVCRKAPDVCLCVSLSFCLFLSRFVSVSISLCLLLSLSLTLSHTHTHTHTLSHTHTHTHTNALHKRALNVSHIHRADRGLQSRASGERTHSRHRINPEQVQATGEVPQRDWRSKLPSRCPRS